MSRIWSDAALGRNTLEFVHARGLVRFAAAPRPNRPTQAHLVRPRTTSAVWLREGYAEYVARRGTFNYDAARAALIAGDEGVAVRDPYWKYLLLVSHLLDHEGLDVRTLLNDPPEAHEVEARVRTSVRER